MMGRDSSVRRSRMRFLSTPFSIRSLLFYPVQFCQFQDDFVTPVLVDPTIGALHEFAADVCPAELTREGTLAHVAAWQHVFQEHYSAYELIASANCGVIRTPSHWAKESRASAL